MIVTFDRGAQLDLTDMDGVGAAMGYAEAVKAGTVPAGRLARLAAAAC